uniref:MAM and LDL-receptor class A domain-containing protein 1-like isoform X1 n=1 Tax=Dermatophagoides pteronyssinus TaxID=6956 RepID=A0A6P6Y6U1_DERPT|nr:MAM and LDL-receptor class A domain-containing protein 1-like isoform X1 [Dermatophagoides pteronyssinus]
MNQILQFVCFVYLLSLSTLFINCHEESRCDFQTRECDWKLSSNWKWKPISHDQRSLQLNSTPSIKGNGYELENHLNGGEYMESPELFPESESENFCFIFDYYFMNDGRNDQNNFTLYFIDGDQKQQKIWISPMLYGDYWRQSYVSFARPTSKSFKLKFIADSDGGLAAVKFFRLLFDECPKIGGVCDFETDNCEWKSSYEGGLTIEREIASHTNSPNDIDHTTLSPNGHVLFAKSNPRSDPKATLTSPNFSEYLNQQCFQFWLYVNGPIDYAQLSLYHRTNDQFEGDKEIWKFYATQQMAEEWNRFQVFIDFYYYPSSNLEFRLKYSGSGSILFDDFSMISYRCPMKISCNFLQHTCGWKNNQNNDNPLMWSIGIGRVHDVTKLTFLNSTKNFIYHTKPLLYTDFTELPDGKIGQMQMISEIVEEGISKHGACLRMDYEVWSFDSNTDMFNLNYQTFWGRAETKEKEIWHFNSNDRGNNTVTLQLPYTHGELFRLILTAKSAHSSTYITVKEIQFWEKSSVNDDCSKKPDNFKNVVLSKN